MREEHSFFSAMLGELTRRKVLRSMGAYAVAVFAILQLMDAAVEPLRLPEWLPTIVVIVLILGFPLAFMLAWLFDVTAGGIRRTRSASLLTGAQSFMLFSVMMLATGALGFSFYQYYAGVFESGKFDSLEVVEQRNFTAPENSIAVLPFADLSEDGDQAHFSDGMSEEILNLLAQVDGLHVAARTSSFAFRNPQKDIREIGRALNVSTVLEGSIRTAGNRIRLTAQLINVEDGYHIWSSNYDRELDDLFAIQDEVAEAIAAALVDSFAGLSNKPAARTQNLAAFEAYRTGRLHWWRRSPQELQRAIELFGTALENDPAFAPAYAALADSIVLMSLYGNITTMRAVERAMPMIEKALAIDPESAEAFAALGLARLEIGQVDSAESALRQAVRLNGDYIPARLWLANALGQQGKLPEQGLVLKEAMAIDPLNELLAINYSGNLDSQGDYAGARDMMEGLIMLKPDSVTLLRSMAGQAISNGHLVDGWRYATRAYDLEPESPVVIGGLAKVWLELGEIEKAEGLLQDGMDLAAENMDLKTQFFWLLLVDGRFEEAEHVVKDHFGDSVESLPENFQRYYHFQMGMLNIAKGNLETSRDEFEQSISNDERDLIKGDQVMALTMVAYLHRSLGDEELAVSRLEQAEQAVRRARINGIDHAGIYYTETSIHVIKGENEQAVESLRLAYEKGFREAWVLKLDGRMNPLREMPGFVEIQRLIEDDVARALAEVRSQTVAGL